ncbi:oligosaccharide flippase family protein [Rheinheimera sp.]|uniref:oligosaccharide flippase family protein n=1 Tax=Rheinheimera sp. TaxID=1869214 RepID=UPI0027362C2C|nr:oligosaccharide flippase family protein [Rheinheimera sp.]MDP2715680.1 oligosaccharide flippase family protein [Rheinheimera sp.]
MNASSKFYSNVFIYLASNIVYFSIPFFLLPLLTRILTIEEYGTLGLFQTLSVLFVHFVSLGTQSYIIRAYFDDIESRAVIVKSNYLIYISMLAVVGAIVLILYNFDIWIFPIELKYVLLAILCSFFTCVLNIRLFIFQAEQSAFSYGKVQVAGSALNVVMTLFFVFSIFPSLDGRVYAVTLSLFLISVYCTFTLKKQLILAGESADIQIGIKRSLVFGLPLMPHLLGAFLISYFDRFFIEDKFSLADVGIYVFSVQVASIAGFLFDSIQKAYIPFLFSFLKNNGVATVLVRKFYFYLALVFSFPFLFFFFGEGFVRVYAGEKYLAAVDIIFILLLGQSLRGLYLVFSGFLSYYKKNFLQSCITISCGVLSVILIIVLSRYFGLYGVALSNFFAMLSFFLMTGLFSILTIRRRG